MNAFLALMMISVTAALIGGSYAGSAEAKPVCGQLASEIQFYKKMTWTWQDQMHVRRTRVSKDRSFPSCRYARWVANLWMARAHAASISFSKTVDKKMNDLRKLQAVISAGALTSDWVCIHNGEGAWNANTGNGYYGGLQMDWGFMKSYGAEFLARWGTANNWPVWAQVTAANRAKNSGRGYGPWPNTARACGLL